MRRVLLKGIKKHLLGWHDILWDRNAKKKKAVVDSSFFFLIDKEKYHKRKNVYNEYTKEAQQAKGERKS